jgi:hypothetical protein
MSISKRIFLLFLIFTFILGLYVTMYWNVHITGSTNEPMGNRDDQGCPNLLVQKGNALLLYNTNKPEDENNPISFFNLDEYINYLEIQKSKGNSCPVLYLQQENNAQGNDVYRMRPSPFDKQGGLPVESAVTTSQNGAASNVIQRADASRANMPYNKDQYPGFDPTSQYVGQYTDIDAVHDSTNAKKISDNPMDSKWAGVTYTQQMVDSGKYVDREITKPSFFNPKVAFYPSIPSVMPGPKDIL